MELIEFPLDRVRVEPSFDLEQLSETLLDISLLLIESKGQRSRKQRDKSVDLAVQAMQLASAVIDRQLTTKPRPALGRCIQLASDNPRP